MTFTCHHCHTEVELDPLLTNLNKAQISLLVAKTHQCQPQPHNAALPALYLPSGRLDTLRQAIGESASQPLYSRNLIELENDDDDDDDDYDYGIPDLALPPLPSRELPLSPLASAFDELDASFVMLRDDITGLSPDNQPETNGHASDTFSKRIKVLTHIFQILSLTTTEDHPLSGDCADLLVENYKLKYDHTQREKELYGNFLAKLQQKHQLAPHTDVDTKLDDAQTQLNELKTIEATKIDELVELENHQAELQQQLKSLTGELQRLQLGELEQALVRRNLAAYDATISSLRLAQTQLVYKSRLDQLDRLRHIDVFALLFNISVTDDGYGSINGYRLGHHIVWLEVNAALGQVVLLLVFLIKKLSVNLVDFKLVPIGLKLQIIKYQTKPPDVPGERRTKSVLNLYLSNEFSLGRLFNFNKLDVLMIAVVEIVLQIQERLYQLDGDIELPYPMSAQGLVGGKLVRVTSNHEWTEGCKHLLINLKWMLTWVKSRGE